MSVWSGFWFFSLVLCTLVPRASLLFLCLLSWLQISFAWVCLRMVCARFGASFFLCALCSFHGCWVYGCYFFLARIIIIIIWLLCLIIPFFLLASPLLVWAISFPGGGDGSQGRTGVDVLGSPRHVSPMTHQTQDPFPSLPECMSVRVVWAQEETNNKRKRKEKKKQKPSTTKDQPPNKPHRLMSPLLFLMTTVNYDHSKISHHFTNELRQVMSSEESSIF